MPATSPAWADPPEGVGPPDTRCWIFDVDGCLVDSLSGTSLRPGAREILEHLAKRTRVFLWSAGGAGYARARAEQFRVDYLLSGYFSKEGRDADGCYLTTHLPVWRGSAVFVDDRPEDLAGDVDLLTVSPYITEDPHDRGLDLVAQRAGLTGLSRR